MDTTRRVGLYSATASAALSIAYILGQLLEWQGLLGSAGGAESTSTPLGIAVLLTPSLLLGCAFVTMMAALHQTSLADRKAISQAALAFATMYATLVTLVYFVQLTLVGPRTSAGDMAEIEFLRFVPYRSFLFAVDLLGYSFMSLATLFGAFALPDTPPARAPRLFMLATGLLLPTIALQMYFPDLIWLAALWGITFPAAMVLVAVMFAQAK
ncbi:MAG TPA: hypothetical protein VJL82_09735 [Rhizomicrobium sp.]|nr:hypothetical protein [Rhizomicrobium sp.]